MKALGIDFGTKRIGMAISDETQTLARELSILSPKQFWADIPRIVEQEAVAQIVVGMPLNMSGGRTDKSREVEQFVERLHKIVPVPIELMDERLSTSMARNTVSGRTHVDSIAAQIILQNYLNKNKH